MTSFPALPSISRGSHNSITNLLSAFGRVRENSLSAMLGYLVHLNPQLAKDLFEIDLPVRIVSLELASETRDDRYDIVIENLKTQYLIEVKIASHSPSQLHRYLRKSKNIVTIGSRLQSYHVNRTLHKSFYSWDQIANGLTRSKSKGKYINHITMA